ncbi:MAG: hypothetical protein P1U74_11370 [Legionellaceae bacterium]|nr:hypothetical protein [Legionellaceae bacterium]
MQKHTITLSSIIISLILSCPSFASTFDVNQLIVNMKNVGAETCLLRSLKIFQGEMIGGNIPRTLHATGQDFWYVLQGQDIDLIMKYQCGRYKDFSISMKKHYSRRTGRAEILTAFFDEVNVFERHTIEAGYVTCTSRGCSSFPSRINWEISN